MKRARFSLCGALLWVCVVLIPGDARGQVDTAELVVRAFDDKSISLDGVALLVRSDATGLERRATTDQNGEASISALTPGAWRVSARLVGFETIEDQEAVLRIGQTVRVHLIMRRSGEQPTAMEEVVVVGSRSESVDILRHEPSTNILPVQIEHLPVPDRQFERLALLAPNVQPDPTQYFGRTGTPVLGGAGSAWSNTYVVDGIDLTDPGNGQPALRISQDAIREVRVIPQGFQAEIGLSPGGALSIVTRSGGNELSGSVFGFYRADALRAQGALEKEGVDFSRYHVGLTLGGAIVPDHTHFFASFEGIQDDSVALYRPGGAFTGDDEDVPQPTSQTLALLGIDHAFTGSSVGTAKFVYENRKVENDQVGGVADRSHGWMYDYDILMLLAGHTWIIDERHLNELRVLATQGHTDARLNSSELGEWFSQGTTRQTGAHLGGDAESDATSFRLQNTFHLEGPRGHQIRTGVSFQHYRWWIVTDRFQHGLLVYGDDTRDYPLVYFYGIGSSEVTFDTDLVGLFIQDDWRVSDDLTVGLGIRYDLELGSNNPDFEHTLVGDRSLDTDNVQPRLGLVWDVGGRGRTVLRGGAGRYTGRYLHFAPIWELQFNGESGRKLFTNVSSWAVFGDDRAPIDINDPEHSGIVAPPDITLLADNLEAPESNQVNLGVSQRLGESRLVLEADLLWAEGRKELVFRDTNWKGNDDPCMEDRLDPCRINPAYGKIDRFTSEGRSRYKALSVSLGGTLEGGHLLSASVTLADKKNIMDDALTPVRPSDSANVEGEWGRSVTDERYRLVISGIFYMPWGLTLSPVFEFGSGTPWNRLMGFDANGDGAFDDRPDGVARNDQDGPPFRQLSLRLTKSIALGSSGALDVVVEAFNVFNTTNYDVTSVSNNIWTKPGVPNERFGTYTATRTPREIQVGLRYVF